MFHYHMTSFICTETIEEKLKQKVVLETLPPHAEHSVWGQFHGVEQIVAVSVLCLHSCIFKK